MTINDAVANRVSNLLKEKNITQYRLEQNAGIAHGAMDRIMTSQNKTVTLTTIYKIAQGFGITFMEFIDDELFKSDDLEIE